MPKRFCSPALGRPFREKIGKTVKTMKAVLLHGYGNVDQLAYEDVPIPLAAAGQVLVKLTSTSVNPIDYKIRRGDMRNVMPLKLPFIPGYDLAGQVVALGEGVTDIKVDTLVMGVTDNTYAEYVACKAEILALMPQGLNPSEAGAFPLVLQAGSQLIEKGVAPQPGQRVLVTGALGGVITRQVTSGWLRGMFFCRQVHS